jgi:hypothetical protein
MDTVSSLPRFLQGRELPLVRPELFDNKNIVRSKWCPDKIPTYYSGTQQDCPEPQGTTRPRHGKPRCQNISI